MQGINTRCFVCRIEIDIDSCSKNSLVMLPVCDQCKDSENEKKVVSELLEGMADDFVCGCI